MLVWLSVLVCGARVCVGDFLSDMCSAAAVKTETANPPRHLYIPHHVAVAASCSPELNPVENPRGDLKTTVHSSSLTSPDTKLVKTQTKDLQLFRSFSFVVA